MSKTILYIAMSTDGFIASENDNLDFLHKYQIEGEDYGYHSFIESVDAIIVGRKTYNVVMGLGFPYHPDKKIYVITRNEQHSNSENLLFYQGNLPELVSKLKSNTTKNIYCDGGAELAKSLIHLNLIDEIILSVIPTDLKSGTQLFDNGFVPAQFELINTTKYPIGLTQYHYQLNSNWTEIVLYSQPFQLNASCYYFIIRINFAG